jgi:hypothetical protein
MPPNPLEYDEKETECCLDCASKKGFPNAARSPPQENLAQFSGAPKRANARKPGPSDQVFSFTASYN